MGCDVDFYGIWGNLPSHDGICIFLEMDPFLLLSALDWSLGLLLFRRTYLWEVSILQLRLRKPTLFLIKLQRDHPFGIRLLPRAGFDPAPPGHEPGELTWFTPSRQ